MRLHCKVIYQDSIYEYVGAVGDKFCLIVKDFKHYFVPMDKVKPFDAKCK